MSEQYANVTVSHRMHGDRRFDLLAELGGWSRREACWRMVELWARCTALHTDRPAPHEIRVHLGLRGEQLLAEAALGERLPDGSIRVLGGGLSGGDTDRFGWYEPVQDRNAAGGRARADQVRRTGRAPRGRFAPATTSDHQRPDQQPTSVTSGSPAAGGSPPASGFRIPDQRSELSLPHAIPPAVPESAVPTVSPPAPAHEDIAGTQPGVSRAAGAIAGDQFEASKSPNRPAIPDSWTDQQAIANRDVEPASAIRPYNPEDPRARGRLAEATYRRVSDALVQIAAELKLPEPLPFPAITPGSETRGLVELRARIREEGELAPAACDRVVANLIAQARAKRSIEWLAEKAFGDKAWVNARNGVDPSARTAPGRSGSPPAPPPPRRADPGPSPVVVSKAELEDVARLAAEARAMLFGATGETPPASPASLPTAELVKRFGDGQRAPPESTGPSDEEPRKPPARRKAGT